MYGMLLESVQHFIQVFHFTLIFLDLCITPFVEFTRNVNAYLVVQLVLVALIYCTIKEVDLNSIFFNLCKSLLLFFKFRAGLI